jgi:hypothetical protein
MSAARDVLPILTKHYSCYHAHTHSPSLSCYHAHTHSPSLSWYHARTHSPSLILSCSHPTPITLMLSFPHPLPITHAIMLTPTPHHSHAIVRTPTPPSLQLREAYAWRGLMLDGSHEDEAVNLHTVSGSTADEWAPSVASADSVVQQVSGLQV